MFLLFHGNINSINSVGTNELIKQGGKMVTTYDEILQNISITYKIKYVNEIRKWKI